MQGPRGSSDIPSPLGAGCVCTCQETRRKLKGALERAGPRQSNRCCVSAAGCRQSAWLRQVCRRQTDLVEHVQESSTQRARLFGRPRDGWASPGMLLCCVNRRSLALISLLRAEAMP
jgi:hypothetical protein